MMERVSEPFQGDLDQSWFELFQLANLSNSIAKETIDAKGFLVSPGFIDMHTHLEPIYGDAFRLKGSRCQGCYTCF